MYITYHSCVYSRLLVDEPSGSKLIEEIKKLKLKYSFIKCVFRWFVLYYYVTMHGAGNIKLIIRVCCRLSVFDIDIFVNCSWVVTRWQYTFTHKQYTEQHK
jgi:hypothetical protein